MYAYQSLFVKNCRVIANDTRLRLLWLVFQKKNLCVNDISNKAKISPHNGSHQLAILAEAGFIEPIRKNRAVFYRPAKSPRTQATQNLLSALHCCYEQEVTFSVIIHQATAFTHERRIQIVRCLSRSDRGFYGLLIKTGMTEPAQIRHLRKLTTRGFVQKKNNLITLLPPSDDFSQCLLNLAIR